MLSIGITNTIFSQNLDSILTKLTKVMENKSYYTISKEQNIQSLKQLLLLNDLLPEQLYDINTKLYKEYKKYKSDSAVYYILKNQNIATILKNKNLQWQANIQLAGLYSTQGLYIESKNILDNIDKTTLSDKLLPDYYEGYMDFYSHYGQSNNNFRYYQKSGLYRDSLLSVLDPQSLRYQITYATRVFYEGEKITGEKMKMESLLLQLLEKTTDEQEERALIAYLLGHMYKEGGNTDLQEKYFSISAITDIMNCIRDNASLQSLSLTYYAKGDINKAYKFMQFAIDDAVFCNVRYRTLEASAFYPIINTSYRAKEAKQKSELQTYLILICVLSVILIIGILYVYKQMKRLSQIKKELYSTNQRQVELNKDLHQVNNELQEANLIKEEYIARFFDLCSTYIDKLENYHKALNKKASNNQLDDLFKMLKSTTIIENELEDLYKNFDEIILNLYPSFVDGFNSLLIDEEQVQPKHGELLNTELRIFALIRLGITDSVKIASFLRYSLRTVYNYRTKMRNKSAVSRDKFEDMVKKIDSFNKS
jgi:DNA-binding CsgD family transcriptional regulator